ncbi:MAG: type II/IV secretion system protein [Candidatus Pacebacteria bacterium]|nr:type II/IV secretion system protein [Candidatus Paceibacterota bacterium]
MQHLIHTNNDDTKKDIKELKEKVQDETIQKLYHKSEEEKASAIANKYHLPYVDLSLIPVVAETIKLIPKETAQSAGLAVIYKVGKKLQIAVKDPENYETKKALEKIKTENGMNYTLIVVSEDSLKKAWLTYDTSTVTKKFEDQGVTLKKEDLTEFEKGVHNIIDLKKRIAEINTTEIFNIIMAGAIKTKSSDVHIEPNLDYIRLRYRVDGVLQDIVNLPIKASRTIISRVKMLSKMKLNVSNMPQDGHFSINLENKIINIRASILPSSFGESIVMRILSEDSTGLKLDELGFNQYYMEKIEEQLLKPTGMLLVTGPTGSGKTTTLYSFLHRLNQPNIKIITLENPVEYRLEGISQTEIHPDAGLTFAEGLKAVVRQDPDVVMVGEIRDPETAEISIQAALTGHSVLSTLHTNNAAGAIPRLLHLKVSPTLISPSINAIIAQRLVRTLCEHCKEEYAPAQETIDKLKEIMSKIPRNSTMVFPKDIKTIYRSSGCSKCNFIGYSGRIGLYEMFTLTQNIEKIILQSTSASEVMAKAREDGMITIQEDGILKAIEGITSLEEIRRVTGEIFVNKN